jgi:nucleoside-diphosphate-sugar epimerase
MNNTVLITGIHGFVGSNLIAALKSQHTVYGLDIISPQVEGVIKTFEWDELNKIPSVDLIIHLAGKAHDTKKQTNAQEYFDINTGLTKKIFDWFITTNAKKFIFFSSVKAVADQVEAEFLTEDMIPNPKGPYGESKMLAEKYILKKKLPGDKKTYILRPCMIHGSGNRGNLNLLYKLVQKGFPWPLGLFNNSRSFTSIDNVSFVISEIIGRDIAPGIYQVADDDAISTNELIQLMAISLDKKTKIWHVPVRLIKAFSKAGDFLHLPLNSERLKKLTETYIVTNQKLKIALGIDKMPISALEGMRKTLDSFKK